MINYASECKNCGIIFKGKIYECLSCGSSSMDFIPDYYSVINCSRKDDFKIIQSSFRKLAKNWHPDRSNKKNSREVFIEISTAYQILSDPAKKTAYDLLIDNADSGLSGDLSSDDISKWQKDAVSVADVWSYETYDKFFGIINRLDELFNETKQKAEKLLKGERWNQKDIIKTAKLVGSAYALVGLWFFIIGAPLFYFIFNYSVRRNPGIADTLMSFTKVVQLLMLLVYIIVIDHVSLTLHIVFFIDQAAILWLKYYIWKKHIYSIKNMVIKP